MRLTIYAEGGGDTKALRTECRMGFREFFRKAGLAGRMPRVSACGSRRQAYEDFCNALGKHGSNRFIALLVDSEGPVNEAVDPWSHLRERDSWTKPSGATEDTAHLMVQCMEAWFFADKEALAKYFGQGFRPNALSMRPEVEAIPKGDIEQGLKNATRECERKGQYNKGRHSFAILAQLDPAKVVAASPYARRLMQILRQKSTQPNT